MAHEFLSTLLQSLLSVIILFLLTRLMGKKQISQLTFFDYVVGITIGSIAADFAVEKDVAYIKGITGMLVYTAFPIALSYISLKNYKVRKLLDGRPIILIQQGKIMEKALRRSKLTVNDLLEECRQQNAFDIADVEYAIFETSGRVSVLLKAPQKPLTPADMQIPVQDTGLCTNVIADGKIIHRNLDRLHKSQAWLRETLQQQNVSRIEDVLLCYIHADGHVHIDRKHSDPPAAPLD